MVLWSLDKSAFSRTVFESSTHFAVHVLTLEQRELAHRFARRGADKFEGLPCGGGLGDVPLLTECAACFECETRNRYDGGDHVIFVGEVKRFKHMAGSPLVFHDGAFAEARQLSQGTPIDAEVDEVSGRFGPDFLCYLIARAHFQTYRPLAREFERAGINETEYFALSMLCIRDDLTYAGLAALLEHTGHAPSRENVADMAAKGHIILQGEEGAIHITETGRRTYVLVLALDGRIASRALARFTPREITEFGDYLRRVIRNTDPGAPDVWTYSLSDAPGAGPTDHSTKETSQ